LVLIHGSLSDARSWEHQLPALAERHRVIAYSRRYSPPNEPVEPGATDPMPPHVDDLLALLRELGAAPAHLVGDSWGGFIALLAALREPGLVRSLALGEPPALSLFVSTPPRPSELLSLALRRPRTAAAIVRLGAGVMAPAQKRFDRGDDEGAMLTVAHGLLGREVFESLPEARRAQARENLPTLRAQLPAGFPPLDEGAIQRLQIPTLLLEGTAGPVVFRRLIDRLEELLPVSERVTIEGASHGMHEQRPDEFNRALLEFLARAGA